MGLCSGRRWGQKGTALVKGAEHMRLHMSVNEEEEEEEKEETQDMDEDAGGRAV